MSFGAGIYLTYIFWAVPFADTHTHIINCIKSLFFAILVKNGNVNSLKVLNLG